VVRKITVFVSIFAIILLVIHLFPKGNAKFMKIMSSAFENNTEIPMKYSCGREGINPPLSFQDVPVNAKSLALIMDDPDAPNGTFVHWVLFNIDPKTQEIKENSIPQGALRGKTSAGRFDYVAVCPPSGTHRYFFKLYALDAVLDLTGPTKVELEGKMQGHILKEAELIGLYSGT
jgi:hypothetical protein